MFRKCFYNAKQDFKNSDLRVFSIINGMRPASNSFKIYFRVLNEEKKKLNVEFMGD